MKILEKTIQAVKDFDTSIVAARNEFEQNKKVLFKTYSNAIAAEKIGAASAALTTFEANATKSARDIITADFAEVRNAVFEFVSKSVPEDFPATLSAIQAKGEKITDFESASFLKKYEDNYMAYSAVLNVLNRNGKVENVYVGTPDKMNDALADLEKRVLNWIQNRTCDDFNGEYYSRLFTCETGNPIRGLADKVEAYLGGGFILDNSHIIPAYEVSQAAVDNGEKTAIDNGADPEDGEG